MQFFKIIPIIIIFLFISNSISEAGILKKLVQKQSTKKLPGCKKITLIAQIKINNKMFTIATVIADDKNIEIIANAYNPMIDYIIVMLETRIPDFHQEKVHKGSMSDSFIEVKIGIPINGHVIIPNFFTSGDFNIRISYQIYGMIFKTNIAHRFMSCSKYYRI